MSYFRNYRNISLYDSSHKQLCYIDDTEANRLVHAETHERFCVSCGRASGEGPCLVAQNHTMAVRELEPLTSPDDSTLKGRSESDCALTVKDVMHNLGVTNFFRGEAQDGTEIQKHNGTVAVAQRRIRFWGIASEKNRSLTIVPAHEGGGNKIIGQTVTARKQGDLHG